MTNLDIHFVSDMEVREKSLSFGRVIEIVVTHKYGRSSISMFVESEMDKRILLTKVAEFEHEA